MNFHSFQDFHSFRVTEFTPSTSEIVTKLHLESIGLLLSKDTHVNEKLNSKNCVIVHVVMMT